MEKRYQKCGSGKRVKRGFNIKEQRCLCKDCGRHYTGKCRGYLALIKRNADSCIGKKIVLGGAKVFLTLAMGSVINLIKKLVQIKQAS